MNNSKIIIWALAGIAALVIGFMLFSPQDGGAKVTNVDGAGMQQLVADGVRVIDVRTPGEFESGHIPGAELVPINEFAATAPAWDRGEPIAIYCATGSRSISAIQALEQLGFAEVYHLDAGMIVWSGEVERGQAVAAAPAPAPQPTGTPVLYEFFTDWWPSCQTMVPVVDGLKTEYEGRVEFRLYDVDKDEEGSALMQQYNAQYVPTFVFVNSDGTTAGQLVGEQSEAAMRDMLDSLK